MIRPNSFVPAYFISFVVIAFVIIASVIIGGLLAYPTEGLAQTRGGILRAQLRGNPPSLSIHEEATLSTNFPAMPLFNNLVAYDPRSAVESPKRIVPELAKSWQWSKDGLRLSLILRKDVKWHDGKPLTSSDVKYTWDVIRGENAQLLRKNPRRVWYQQVKKITTAGNFQVSFHLRAPQPSLLDMLASGYSPVYPAHVSLAKMRTEPVGSGPMRFVHWRRGQEIKLQRNENYWRPRRPYLDEIVYLIIPNHPTRMLAMASGQQQLGFPHDATPQDAQDIQKRASNLISLGRPSNASLNLLFNPKDPVLKNTSIRQAIDFAIDRQAFQQAFGGTKGSFLGGALMSPPDGVWGLPAKEILRLQANRKSLQQAQKYLAEQGYSAKKPLSLVISTRDVRIYRKAASLLTAQLSRTFIRPTIRVIDRSAWHSRIKEGDFQLGMNVTGLGPDNPDAMYLENYSCQSERNYSGYCNLELEVLFQKQSQTRSFRKRLRLVHIIERRLIAEQARPIILQLRGHTILSPELKGLKLRQSAYHGWRLENVWLENKTTPTGNRAP